MVIIFHSEWWVAQGFLTKFSLYFGNTFVTDHLEKKSQEIFKQEQDSLEAACAWGICSILGPEVTAADL